MKTLFHDLMHYLALSLIGLAILIPVILYGIDAVEATITVHWR